MLVNIPLSLALPSLTRSNKGKKYREKQKEMPNSSTLRYHDDPYHQKEIDRMQTFFTYLQVIRIVTLSNFYDLFIRYD